MAAPEFEDRRTFAGAYTHVLWSPAPRWRVEAGLRLNVTSEKQEGEVLDLETADIYEAGVKGARFDGRLSWQAWIYRMGFENLVIAQTVNGLPSLTNAGTQRFDGFELEASWRLRDSLHARSSFAAHPAEFRDYVAEFGGVPTQLAGNRLEMSPDRLASLGLTWFPPQGVLAWGGFSHVGKRYLLPPRRYRVTAAWRF